MLDESGVASISYRANTEEDTVVSFDCKSVRKMFRVQYLHLKFVSLNYFGNPRGDLGRLTIYRVVNNQNFCDREF